MLCGRNEFLERIHIPAEKIGRAIEKDSPKTEKAEIGREPGE